MIDCELYCPKRGIKASDTEHLYVWIGSKYQCCLKLDQNADQLSTNTLIGGTWSHQSDNITIADEILVNLWLQDVCICIIDMVSSSLTTHWWICVHSWCVFASFTWCSHHWWVLGGSVLTGSVYLHHWHDVPITDESLVDLCSQAVCICIIGMVLPSLMSPWWICAHS